MNLNWERKPEQPLLLESELGLIRAGLAEVREAAVEVQQKGAMAVSHLLSMWDQAKWVPAVGNC